MKLVMEHYPALCFVCAELILLQRLQIQGGLLCSLLLWDPLSPGYTIESILSDADLSRIRVRGPVSPKEKETCIPILGECIPIYINFPIMMASSRREREYVGWTCSDDPRSLQLLEHQLLLRESHVVGVKTTLGSSCPAS